MGLAWGHATYMNQELAVISQAWWGDAQQPGRRPVAQTKYDAFVIFCINHNTVSISVIWVYIEW